MSAYDLDFFAWTKAQAAALGRRSANEVDWDNLAEEVAALGRSEARELHSRLKVLLAHLLKWTVQPAGRSGSWRSTIRVQRKDIARLLSHSPSLQSAEDGEFADAYESARLVASAETGFDLARFPAEPPFTLEQAKDEEFWPD